MCFTVLPVVVCSGARSITESFVVDEKKVIWVTSRLVDVPAESAETDDSDEFSCGSMSRPTELFPVRPQSKAKTVP